MKIRIITLAVIALASGCMSQTDEPAAVPQAQDSAAPVFLPELIRAATTRPWPGKNYPELPGLPTDVVQHAAREIESSPDVRGAYAKLDAEKQRNVSWFEGVAELETQKAVWSLLTCLCHPHDDVQIHTLRALARLKDERTLPFLLQYASAMAVLEGGSENATLHGIIHDETAKTLSAITGLQFKMRGGQDPEGLKAAIATSTTWWMKKTGKVPTKPSTATE
jgi:hypothetical protein